MEHGAVALKLTYEPLIIRNLCYDFLSQQRDQGVVKLSIFAGMPYAPVPGYGYDGHVSALILFEFRELPHAAPLKDALKVCSVSSFMPETIPALRGLKLTSALHYVIWSSEVLSRGYDQGIIFAPNGLLVEGTISNLVLLLEDGTAVTPALESSGVQGVMRAALLDHGIIQSRNRLDEKALIGARQAYLINSVRGAQAVKSYTRNTEDKPCRQWNHAVDQRYDHYPA